MQPMLKKGFTKVASTTPEYPGSHKQVLGTFIPRLVVGQKTAVHAPLKNGVVEVAEIDPLYPALHSQPVGSVPRPAISEILWLFIGHITARQVLLKNGLIKVPVTDPS